MFKLIRDKHSILTLDPKPDKEVIIEHYKNIYYQKESGLYKKEYTEKDLNGFRNKAKVFLTLYEKYCGSKPSNVFEPGFGEGFTLNYFNDNQIECFGVDLSQEGLLQHNSKLISTDNIKQGSFEDGIYFDKKFDLIILDHILEHVYDIDKTMENLIEYVKNDSLVIVLVPNEFNLIQNIYLEKNNLKMEDAPWIQEVEHIRYFQKETLDNLFSNYNFQRSSKLMSDFPIDMNILFDDTDYYKNPSMGKNAYNIKLEFETMLINKSVNKYIDLCESFADNDIGRNLIAVYKLN